MPSFHGDVVPVALPPGSAQAAALLSQRLGVTTLAIVSAAWRLLLSAEAGHCGGGPEGGYAPDASGAVVLGTPTACRGRLEDHDVVGCLSSMLPLLPGAATYAAGDTFESLVQREAAALAAAVGGPEALQLLVQPAWYRKDANEVGTGWVLVCCALQ